MRTNRRDFLKTLGGIAAFTIVPRHVLGKGFIAPSDQLIKGIIGTGGMGRRSRELCRNTSGSQFVMLTRNILN